MLRQLLHLALSTGLILGVGACATGTPVEPAAEPTAPATVPADTTAAAAEPTNDPPAPERVTAAVTADYVAPSDYDVTADYAVAADAGAVDEEGWLLDEETGKRYRVLELPKVEGKYQHRGEYILLHYGLHLELLEEGPDWLRVRTWESDVELEPRSKEPQSAPVAVAAEYESDLERVDELIFEPFDSGLPTAGQWREGFELADMNGDGHLDLVFGPARKQLPLQPHIYLGDGAGGWQRWAVPYPAESYDYGDVGVGDFDGDGRPDIALGMHLRGMVAMVQGDAGFDLVDTGMERLGPGVAAAFASRAVTVLDWNGDGRDDVLAMGEGPSRARSGRDDKPGVVAGSRGLLVYLNQGDGSWQAFRPQEILDGGTDFGTDLVLVDVDGDGDDDVVAATARLGNRSVLHRRDGQTTVAQPVAALRGQSMVDAVAAGDLDGDGHADLVVGVRGQAVDGWRSGADVLWGHGDGTFTSQVLWSELGRHGVTAVAVGDVDGDGVLDVVAGSGDQRLAVLLGTGDRGFALEESPELPAHGRGCAVSDLRLADLDGDGRDEMVASFAGEATGLPGISADLFQVGCPTEGSLRAWTPAPRRGR